MLYTKASIALVTVKHSQLLEIQLLYLVIHLAKLFAEHLLAIVNIWEHGTLACTNHVTAEIAGAVHVHCRDLQ